MPPRLFLPRLLAALAAGLATCAAAQDNVRLPDLGSSANALVSPREASDYGAAMLHQMRALDMVVDDPLVDDYINDLGYRLVAASDKPRESFTFFVADDDVINAFAAPGGYIAVNSGLFTMTRDESELAGVLAHEIGHITQHHLERAFEDSKKNAPLMALVLLGAIAASAGSHSGDAPIAVLAGGQGLIAQRSINFTRKDEVEADRIGIQTLARAGFDPNAMAGFFQRMQDALAAGSGGEAVPTLLQTHPVTTMRISDAKARAGALIEAQKRRPAIGSMDLQQWEKSTAPIDFVKDPAVLLNAPAGPGPSNYTLMRERVRVLTGDATRLAKWYADSLATHPDFDTPENHYGYALALLRGGRAAAAIKQLAPLATAWPDRLALQLALADARLEAGERDAALALYAKLDTQSPRNRAITLAWAKALTAGGTHRDALLAANLLRPLLNDASEPELYRAFARASEVAGNPVLAGEAFADASYYSGRPYDAMEQLKRLLQREDVDYYARARIQARIAELTPLLMELSKRRIQTVDRPDAGQRQ